MPNPVTWQEIVSRGTAIALMSNFTSVAEALKELVDNAIDYRRGQPLTIDITQALATVEPKIPEAMEAFEDARGDGVDKLLRKADAVQDQRKLQEKAQRRRDRLVVESDGGRGMGAEEIQVWLNWGEGEQHTANHIGRWHQGGKAACGFLGGHLKLWAKRAGSDDVWFLEDGNWSERRDPRDFGEPKPISEGDYPAGMKNLPTDRGHVRIELTKLVKERRWNLEVLRRDLSGAYRCLLESGDVTMRINGDRVAALDIPLSTAVKEIPIDVRLAGGKAVSGWAARMKRDQLAAPIKAGLRLVFNGRLIREGEWFGYNYEGKGALNSLVGEAQMKGFTPVPNKTDFVDRGDDVWDELGNKILEQLAPLISELRKSGEDVRVTNQEKERAREVAEELEKVLSELDEEAQEPASSTNGRGPEQGEGGRKRPEARQPRPPVQNPRGSNKNPRQPRTPPPEDPAGSLARILEKVTGGSTRPPIRIRGWGDGVERSAWTTEGTKVFLDINKSYPLYKYLQGAKPYLAETVILLLCGPNEGEPLSASQYVDRVNLMLLRWARVADQSASA